MSERGEAVDAGAEWGRELVSVVVDDAEDDARARGHEGEELMLRAM